MQLLLMIHGPISSGSCQDLDPLQSAAAVERPPAISLTLSGTYTVLKFLQRKKAHVSDHPKVRRKCQLLYSAEIKCFFSDPPGQNPAVQCCEVPCSGKKLSSQSAVYGGGRQTSSRFRQESKTPPGSPCICSRKKIPLFSVCCTPGNTVHRSSQDCPAVLLPSDAGSLRMLFF